jgi:alkane 1-monooxygenase
MANNTDSGKAESSDTDSTGTIPAGSTAQWRDKKRYLWLIGLVMPSLVFLAIGLYAWTRWGIWFWLGPIVILGIVPVIDLAAGLDRSNPPDDIIEALENDKYYRWITYLFLPLQYAGFLLAFWYIATKDVSVVDKIGLATTVGFIGGIGINTAHELGHKKESVERWLS